jgi:hypothetical protein
LISKRAQKIILLVVAVAAAFYGMVYVDVVLRARDAWLQGEQYWRWADHPEERQAYLRQKLALEEAELTKKQTSGQLTADDYARDKELLEFRYTQMGKESSIKYAYVWYQTAVDLFSPPDSKWVRMSREKMPLAKERWKAELKAQKIPFEDYMID